MYLKQIQICGFKSFVDPTTIDLTEGIGAIIGPNGCGKSNVLDAVRWVLGEQNPRVLRADKMADLIWAGSSTRKATSFSEATLVFADCEQTLSMDYNEISISRRLYRTGESEYLINKTSCRLKDIEGLFMDTGLGPHAYSIMEQGKIDQLLQMKPEQRRFIFEEAAGITKYQTRKDEAVRKLSRTEENLVRLNDIIAEVKRQVNSVERQARAAKRYQEFETELRKLEVSFSKQEFDRMSSIHKEMSDKLESARKKNTEMTLGIETSEKSLDESRHRTNEIDTLLSQNRQQKFDTESQTERLESQIKIAQSVITNAEETLNGLATEIRDLEQRRDELQGQKDGFVQQQNEFTAQIARQRQVITEHQQSLNAIVGDLRRVENSIQQGLNDIRQKNERSAKLQVELGAIGANLISIETRRNELSRNLTEKEQVIVDVQSKVQSAKDRVAGFDTSIKQCQNLINQYNQQINEVRTQKTQHFKDLDQVRQELGNRQSRRNSLIALKESFEGYQSGTKSLLQAKKANQSQCSGINAPIASLIHTEAQYDVAIETALGNALNYLVTDTVSGAKSALDFLQQNKKGSATLLSLDLVKDISNPTIDSSLLQSEGVMGRASDLVKCDQGYEPIIRHLLGNTLIVKDLDTALSLTRQGNFNGEFVTLSGERVTTYGAITGGSVKTTGLLAQDREISSLATLITQLEQKVKSIQEQISLCDQKNAELEKERNEQQRQAHEQEIQRAGAQRDVESLTGQQRNLEREIGQLQTSKTNSQSEEDRQRNRQGQLQAELKRLEEEVQTANQQVESWRSSVVEINQKRESQGEMITRLQVELATLENQFKNIQQQVSQAANALASQNSLLQQKYQQKQLNEKKKADSQELITQSQTHKTELDELKAKLEKTLQELTTEKQQAEDKINELSRTLAELRRDQSQVFNEVHELEIQVNEFTWKIDNLRQRIQETYHLDVAEPIELEEDVDLTDTAVVNNRINELKQKIAKIGPVNFSAIEEYEEAQKRYEQLKTQEEDAKTAISSLRATINHINSTTKDLFVDTFNAAQRNFHEVFRHLFRGGNARLIMVDEENPLESGIDVIVQPPGKNLQNITLLSGGEKALSAIALLFSIYLLKPAPLCVLDEIDAPLDDMNIGRFTDMLKEMVDRSQFLVITHNKRTMEAATNLYGVTMEEPGVSKVVAVKVTGEALYDDETLASMNFNQDSLKGPATPAAE